MDDVINIGRVPWTRQDLRNSLGEFLTLYQQRPISANTGGMRAPHMFATWFIARALSPEVIIESGVWKGQSTWLLEQACPDARIFSIDVDLSERVYISERAEYLDRDFANHDWAGIDGEKTLAFFDDHQNALERVRQCLDFSIRHVIFEDNYPASQGDCYSLKKAFCEAGSPLDARYLATHLDTYYEFPPVAKSATTRWGDAWDHDHYPTPPPLLASEEAETFPHFQEEAQFYTWLCYVQLRLRANAINQKVSKHYNAGYFSWQAPIGEFGGWANRSKFSAYIEADNDVMDFGCGVGALLHGIDCRGKLGIEVNDLAAEEARNRGLDVYRSVDEAPDECVDVIISNHALEHTLNPLEELQSLYHKLRLGGKIIFVVPCEGITQSYQPGGINHHLYTWNPMCLGNLFTESGFHVIESKPYIHKWPPRCEDIARLGGRRLFDLACRIYGRIERSSFQVRVIAEKRSEPPELVTRPENYLHYDRGFFDDEGSFRWCAAEARATVLQTLPVLALTLGNNILHLTDVVQRISIRVNGELVDTLTLDKQEPAILKIQGLDLGDIIEFSSDFEFCPKEYGGRDKRVLSFMLSVDTHES